MHLVPKILCQTAQKIWVELTALDRTGPSLQGGLQLKFWSDSRPCDSRTRTRTIRGVKRLSLIAVLVLGLTACNREPENLARATALHPQGRQVFERNNCIRCHNSGEGGFGKRMVGNVKLRDLEYIRNRVIKGKTVGAAQMPGYPNMDKKDLEEVSKFVRALAGWED